MAFYTVTFKHSLGDRVKITELEGLVGTVESMSVHIDGTRYKVSYWDGGKRLEEWVRGDEIQ